MKTRFWLSLIMLLSGLHCFSQALWTSADVKKSFGKHWGLGAEVEYRTHDGFDGTDRITFALQGDYKFSFLKIDAGYKYILGHTLDETTRKGNIIPSYWINRHRAYLSVSGKLKLGRFGLSLRERYQFTHRIGKWVPKFASDGVTSKSDEWISSKDKHTLRSRLFCEYSIKKSRFTPFVSVEVYDNLSSGFEVEKCRYTVGSEYKINKRNRLELFYRFIQGVEAGEENTNVIGVGYSFKL